jgi:hypothetical protein
MKPFFTLLFFTLTGCHVNTVSIDRVFLDDIHVNLRAEYSISNPSQYTLLNNKEFYASIGLNHVSDWGTGVKITKESGYDLFFDDRSMETQKLPLFSISHVVRWKEENPFFLLEKKRCFSL